MRYSVDPTAVKDVLAQHRLAVVGASEDPRSFGNTIFRELKSHGYDTVPVNPNVETIDGETCYPDIASVPGVVDGVVMMVKAATAPDVIRECVGRGIKRVWLFKGLGGSGALSDEAMQLCQDNHIEVVAGACPLMFLEPVAWFHRAHRGVRRLNGSLAKAS